MGLFDKMFSGLAKTRKNMEELEQLFQNYKPDSKEFYEDLEELLLMSDVGAATAARVSYEMNRMTWERRFRKGNEARAGLTEILMNMLDVGDTALKLDTKPSVVIMVGVNGVGKTTTIGKLAARMKDEGKNVLLCAGDTFRAAAAEQLTIWAERSGTDIVKHGEGSDPAAVVFDGINAAKARGTDVVIVDTAGRLHNKQNLMNELNKITRVVTRELPDADVETLMVLDATTGQNGLEQAKQFLETAGITGIVLTKLDGTAKGGVVFAIANELKLPVKFVGVGEKMDDLIPFDSKDYVEALFKE
jgi:fused signal recognition particle receptor